MRDKTFDTLREMAYRQCGIVLSPQKKLMLASRLRRRMAELELSTFEDYLARLTNDESGEETRHLVNAIATHHTFFFREPEPIQFVADEVVRRVQQGQQRIRIWSTACSSGEEPFTLAMMLNDRLSELGYDDLDLKILATDLSTRILATAEKATYTSARIHSLPEQCLRRHFQRVDGGSEPTWQLSDTIRNMVVFRKLNLVDATYPVRGPFDAILCRNVMIYFDDRTRRHVISRLEHVLRSGGLLVVGMTETALGFSRRLTFERPAVYRNSSANPAVSSPAECVSEGASA
ncbi:MAG TPA: protein-glutamate O-methyltransferase CheR [Planctomycetaceae bacterium]|nr:protein-glutamate O-methyltransferase CheR [Planctomycetaceae bacterium]